MVTPGKLAAYIKDGGGGCPFCGPDGEIVNAGHIEIDHGLATQEVECKCGAAWEDIYDLGGVAVWEPEPADKGETFEIIRPEPEPEATEGEGGKDRVVHGMSDRSSEAATEWASPRILNALQEIAEHGDEGSRSRARDAIAATKRDA